jgi:hypothetical protein
MTHKVIQNNSKTVDENNNFKKFMLDKKENKNEILLKGEKNDDCIRIDELDSEIVYPSNFYKKKSDNLDSEEDNFNF